MNPDFGSAAHQTLMPQWIDFHENNKTESAKDLGVGGGEGKRDRDSEYIKKKITLNLIIRKMIIAETLQTQIAITAVHGFTALYGFLAIDC